MGNLGKNNKSLRLGNKSLVLKNICLNQGVSRIDISKKTGLTKMAVSYIVSELIESGIIKESHTEQVSGAGRNPIILDISEKAPKAAGIYISRDSCSVIVTDLKLKVLFSSNIPFYDENEETLKEKVITLLDKAFKKFGDKIGGIGISTLGPIDCTEGVILNPPNFFGIKNVRIADIVKKQYDVPVIMNNEVNAAALAEKIFGSSSKIDNFIYLALANGIGAGIITGGKLYQNDSSFAGEIGHMSIDYAGETCTCGNKGCIEVYASIPNVEKKLSNTVGKPLPFTELVKLSEDNETIDEILTDVIEKLSVAIINAVNMLDPQAVIIGHMGAYLPDKYIQMLDRLVNSRILPSGYKRVEVVRASFGDSSPLMGSACLVLNAYFEGILNSDTRNFSENI